MLQKRFGAKQIATLLRPIEASIAQGKPTPVACRDAGISQTSAPLAHHLREIVPVQQSLIRWYKKGRHGGNAAMSNTCLINIRGETSMNKRQPLVVIVQFSLAFMKSCNLA
jgi:hypothetical protein